MKKRLTIHYIIIALIFAFLFIPILATFFYSIATQWQTTILPEGFTFSRYLQIFNDQRFMISAIRTLVVSLLSILLSITIMVPTVFVVVVYKPKLEKYLNIIVTIPFAIPGVVLAVGLMKIYSKNPFPITGTIWILLGAYFIFILPYMFQGVRNSLRTVNAVGLMEAAEVLHATKLQAFIKVILPNIASGVVSSALLSFSMLFGEFVITNLLVGGQFETIQIYLFGKRNESGHLTSAIVISYFIVILIFSGVILKIGSGRKAKKLEA